jgi:hypothetical protein
MSSHTDKLLQPPKIVRHIRHSHCDVVDPKRNLRQHIPSISPQLAGRVSQLSTYRLLTFVYRVTSVVPKTKKIFGMHPRIATKISPRHPSDISL